MPWDPEQYHKFQNERFAPFEDVLRLIHVCYGMNVIDLGCGTGELTRRLADYLPDSDVVGIDPSPQMLERAATQVRPGLGFEPGTVEAATGTWDLVFSHAAIQWVDDHLSLVPHLLSLVRPGGQLAVQLPSNHGHPAHTLIAEIATEEPFRQALNHWVRRSPVLSIDTYAELLYRHGARELTVLEKVYPHVLDGPDPLLEWTSGTVLVPYFERLPRPLQEAFIDRYRDRLRACYPAGPVFYGFRRTIFVATQPKQGSTLTTTST
jgi:trans-aconitate 2-methyltransferase